MILGYYGRWTPLEQIRAVAGVSRDGTKASAIVKAGALYGLESRGVKLRAGRPRHSPAVAGDRVLEFRSLRRSRGPPRRPRADQRPRGRTAQCDFGRVRPGVHRRGAHLRARPEFRARRHAVEPRRRACGTACAPSAAPLAAILLIGFLLLVPGLVIPGLQRAFTDFYLVAGLHDWMPWLLGGMAGAAALRMLLTWLQQYNLARFNVRLGLISNGRLLWHILHLPIGFFAQRSTGELANRSSARRPAEQPAVGQPRSPPSSTSWRSPSTPP